MKLVSWMSIVILGIGLTVSLLPQQVHTTMYPMLSQNGPPTEACPGAGILDFDLIGHTLYGCPIAGGTWSAINGMAGGNISYCPDTSQYANSIVCANSGETFTVFNPGVAVIVKVANSVTGPTIIYETGVGIKNVTKNGTTALATNDMVAGGLYLLTYDGAEMVMTQNLGAAAGGGFSLSDLTSVYWREQFSNSATGSATCGFTYFQTGGNTGGASYAFQSVDLNHTPTCRATTGATSTDDLTVYLTGGTSGTVLPLAGLNSLSGSQAWELIAVIRLPAITNMAAKVCVTNSVADSGDTTANGICARFSTNAGDTTWKLVTSASSTTNVVDSTVTVAANTWYKIRLDSSVSGTVGLTVNASARVTSSTDIPSSTLTPELTLKTYTAAPTNMDVTVPLVFDMTGLVKP
jgi:hypothetical protein